MFDEIIPVADISKLRTALDTLTTAKGAVAEQDKRAVARLINYAANTGDHVSIWQHPMSNAMKTMLEVEGYKLKPESHCARPGSLTQIIAR